MGLNREPKTQQARPGETYRTAPAGNLAEVALSSHMYARAHSFGT